ncbi:Uncharacterised protein [Mycobacteroides abscessus subsp. abscessus]|uniref:hypothetical protein n=1 Tax=Mycobacteroides abscessus TaxID=36809 RepID=UPI0005DC8CBE|nr:hypothetical protein [Mycobacteroides abscessus]ANO18562.1 hypothetical protein BAB78_08290 [Mycobacteroides abscessus]MDB2220708.1 hypothetical protein [Mycobacteroides abscessus subsp. abscessus]OTR03291.1 hypothetical protein B9M85_08530 [Mycobacteroides abscessus]CPR84206.1 Uncharacterised protein [Mycobacteroides abscessus]SHT04915.1 putative lipoprotein [Mycobacteroides abscessus subsp. abscessus]
MKKNLILATTSAALVAVGLAACGHDSDPAAQPGTQPFPAEHACADIPRPADPHGLLGNNWLNDNPCAVFNMNRPGADVDSEQAARIVYDARMRALAGKRDIALLARQGNAQIGAPGGLETDFKSVIAQRRAALKAELNASGLALQGRAPEGFRIEYLKNSAPSASPGLTPGK